MSKNSENKHKKGFLTFYKGFLHITIIYLIYACTKHMNDPNEFFIYAGMDHGKVFTIYKNSVPYNLSMFLKVVETENWRILVIIRFEKEPVSKASLPTHNLNIFIAPIKSSLILNNYKCLRCSILS